MYLHHEGGTVAPREKGVFPQQNLQLLQHQARPGDAAIGHQPERAGTRHGSQRGAQRGSAAAPTAVCSSCTRRAALARRARCGARATRPKCRNALAKVLHSTRTCGARLHSPFDRSRDLACLPPGGAVVLPRGAAPRAPPRAAWRGRRTRCRASLLERTSGLRTTPVARVGPLSGRHEYGAEDIIQCVKPQRVPVRASGELSAGGEGAHPRSRDHAALGAPAPGFRSAATPAWGLAANQACQPAGPCCSDDRARSCHRELAVHGTTTD